MENDMPRSQDYEIAENTLNNLTNARVENSALLQVAVAVMMLAGDQPLADRKTVKQYIPICLEESCKELREWLDTIDDKLDNPTALGPISIEDKAELLDAIFDSIWTNLAMLNALGISFSEVWEEGAKSNLAKISPDGKFIKNAQGKIQKPEGWKKPDFARIAAKITCI